MPSIDKILLVDDSEANQLFFTVLLQEIEKSNVFTATTGSEAMELVKQQKIQFVITAWEMAPMPGTILIQRLMSDKSNKYMPFLIYSKRMNEEEVSLTKDLGIDNVLSMPFDREKAKQTLIEIIEKEENLSPLEKKIRKIEGFIDDNKPTEALKLIDASVTKKSPYRHHVKTLLGAIWIMINKFEKAETILNEALKEHPNYFPAMQHLAKVYSMQQRHDEAIGLLKEMTENSPKNIQTLLSLGDAYIDADKDDEARKVLDKVQEMDEGHSQVNDGLGKIAFKEGNMPLAAQLLQETQNADEIARYVNNMGISLVASGDIEKGIETYNNAINLLSDKAKLHLIKYNLGLALRKNNDSEKAFKEFSEAYLLEPNFEKAFAGFARLVNEMKRDGKSVDSDVIQKVKETRTKWEKDFEDETLEAS